MKRVKQTYIARILLFILQAIQHSKTFQVYDTLYDFLYSKCNREVSYDNDTAPKNREYLEVFNLHKHNDKTMKLVVSRNAFCSKKNRQEEKSKFQNKAKQNNSSSV